MIPDLNELFNNIGSKTDAENALNLLPIVISSIAQAYLDEGDDTSKVRSNLYIVVDEAMELATEIHEGNNFHADTNDD